MLSTIRSARVRRGFVNILKVGLEQAVQNEKGE